MARSHRKSRTYNCDWRQRLANSVVLVCRKREDSADAISRAACARTLKRELLPAMAELQKANIAPADMPQSAIGPGMGAFSRCETVLAADDSPMAVNTALQRINRGLDERLGGIRGEFDADARCAIARLRPMPRGYRASYRLAAACLDGRARDWSTRKV